MVADGQIPPVLLLERSVKEKLVATKTVNANERVEQLTKGLSPPNAQVQRLIETRRRGYNASQASIIKGEQLFTQHCRACHQIDRVGTVIGPQLDGIGGRGLERLLEDVLDPNRNVDRAFRNTLLTKADGDVVSGLFRREEGQTLVLADSTGKEISIPKNQVKERRESDTSLMSENFGELLQPDDLNHLMAYLLSKKAAQKP
jgi:putative heme-binding domain-containing protein